MESVKNLRLIQTMVITLEGGERGAKIRDNYMQVYNKQNKDNCI